MAKLLSTPFNTLIVCVSLFVSSFFSMAKGECSSINESGVDNSEQENIESLHNSLRLSLAKGQVSGQPRACDMKKLKYDAKLAEAAQKVANTCKSEHIRAEDPRWDSVGQNIFAWMSTQCVDGADWNTTIQEWFNENKHYNYPDNPKPNTGHYTQVAWSTTQFVGCGYKSCECSYAEKKYYCKFYVCNYGPGGNIQGTPPYQTATNGNCGCENLC